jgi:hypothetical protein
MTRSHVCLVDARLTRGVDWRGRKLTLIGCEGAPRISSGDPKQACSRSKATASCCGAEDRVESTQRDVGFSSRRTHRRCKARTARGSRTDRHAGLPRSTLLGSCSSMSGKSISRSTIRWARWSRSRGRGVGQSGNWSRQARSRRGSCRRRFSRERERERDGT